ncbi:FAD-dependent oxidoreductase [Ligilactobacillus sp. WILCCON 0076]|uniref:FAD-dependent oxidoreductase n=1 Tax=Ligilactobacillus ubinensis TaxID=2876789 RepID=A0A9X2FMH5_9LACO|nr:FAD-dependent oxidoreductase [Ligilactobacillus ubinensis]MCP0887123.1 FAD-dependent oxidoreductase [Ligilactobacillus ubinensis]
MTKKILIIGGVAGGATAATRLRRLSEDDEIILFEKGEYISFANCGLPYHIGGVIKERENLLLQTVEGMQAQYGLDIRNFSEVTAIHPKEHYVEVVNHQTNKRYQETFDKLIISTGAKAITPKITGLDTAENVFSLRNIPDMDKIKAYIQKNNVQAASIIGGGFIGLEMMENLTKLGINVQLVEMSPQVMPNIDFEMAQQIHAQIKLHKVQLYLNDGLKEFRENGKELILTSGTKLQSDLTVLSIGVLPDSTLAKECGIELGFKQGIKVDAQMKTNYADIYAIGDVIEVPDFVGHTATNIPLAWPANRQGRLVADVINGISASYDATQGTSVAKVFELTVAATGNNEQALRRKKLDFQVIHIHPNSHAGYYPDAGPLHLKLLFGKKGEIYGAQGIGVEGVEKRIDVIATAMKLGATAAQLAGLELSYAPPYSSAKDPVNMLGYTADNVLAHKVATIQWSQVDELLAAHAYFLDVREEFELSLGTLPGSHLIPLSTLRHRLTELPKDQPIYVYCQVGQRGYNVARILMQAGFDVKNLDGGFKTYKIGHYQIKNTPFKNSKPVISKDVQEIDNAAGKTAQFELDACGLQCPGPILKVKEQMDKMQNGDQLVVTASDFGFSSDIESWAKNTSNTVLTNDIKGNKVQATLQKGKTGVQLSQASLANLKEGQLIETKDGATMVVFSGNYDKALAAMIIATGAAAMGKKVTLFFTFWGLSILKKHLIQKSGIAKMFDVMLPKDADHLKISSMNMAGLGRKMIKKVMKQKNVDPLPEMIDRAQKLGIKFVACTMSMDIMGVQKEELFDFVEYGGVATYLGDSEQANLNLFI